MKFNEISNVNPMNKSQERLQAQSESFADKSVENFSKDQAKILKYSADLSGIRDLNNLPSDLPEELINLINKNKDAYIDFLRKEKKLETTFIEENIKIYKEKFQPIILELKEKISQGNSKNIAEYLGSGSNGSAFRVVVEGKSYAAKFSKSITQANFEIKPLLKAKGIPHTAQLVCYSFEDGVVIMELLPGTDVTNFTPENAPLYSDGDMIQLIETIKIMDSEGLVIDPKPSNFMYDEKEGFSILDYHLKNPNSGFALPQEIMSLGNMLSARKLEYLDYKDQNYDEKSKMRVIEYFKIYLPIMVRLINILNDKYPDIISGWKQKKMEDKNDPRISSIDLIDRKYIPQEATLMPYLAKLEELGF